MHYRAVSMICVPYGEIIETRVLPRQSYHQWIRPWNVAFAAETYVAVVAVQWKVLQSDADFLSIDAQVTSLILYYQDHLKYLLSGFLFPNKYNLYNYYNNYITLTLNLN